MDPSPLLMQSTAVITINVPTIGPGGTYTTLVTYGGQLLSPIDSLVISTTGLISTDPVVYAQMVNADVSYLWSYLNYGQNLIPGLVSFALLISAYLLVMLVKLILSVVKYVKQIVAQWL